MTISQEETFCADFSLDELFELSCPVTIVNNSFTLDCSENVTDGPCSYTERVEVTGTRVGDTWTVTGTLTTSNEAPADCSGNPACSNVRVIVERLSGPPTACTYAPPNTIASTIVGGPLAGNTSLQTFGNSSGSGGVHNWGIFAQAGTFAKGIKQGNSSNLVNINMNLIEIDESSLPATFEVTVSGGEGTLNAVPAGSVSYYDQTTAGAIFASSGGSGSITVNEVSAVHIAGRINSLNISGMTYPSGGGEPTPGTRSLTGGFYVLSDIGPIATGSAQQKGWVDRLLSK
jgi:hypothetical protein